jgi:hypothetical protein
MYTPSANEQGATKMFNSTTSDNQDRGTAEEKLWRAVIARTLEEWVRGPLRYSRIAEEFLFDDDRDFRAVCSSAGMDPGTLRNRLKSIRERGIQKDVVPMRVRGQKKSNLQNQGLLNQELLRA